MGTLGTSPTSKSALASGAAKDDVLGADGHFTFSISDLLANDPGGTAKVDVTKQFFFGDTAADQANQTKYMADHGIIDNHDGTYTLTSSATDFNYFVQIGNKGTWSQAAVDVTAPVPHATDALFAENFDGYAGDVIESNGTPVAEVTNLNTASGWVGAEHTELGANGYGGIQTTSGDFWLDTQNSPGGINISHTFIDTTAAVEGTTSVLSFDIGTQSLEFNGQHYETDPNASFDLKIDGEVVKHLQASDFANPNELKHFDVHIESYTNNAGTQHTLELIDTSANAGVTGFAIDSIHIHDWGV